MRAALLQFIIVAPALFVGANGIAQLVNLGPEDPSYCAHVEKIRPNLILTKETHVFGQVTDTMGAVYADQKIQLRVFVSENKQRPDRLAITDAAGRFDLGRVKKGKYRLLFSATRAFRQAEKLDCYGRAECQLAAVVTPSPTDQPDSMCPVK